MPTAAAVTPIAARIDEMKGEPGGYDHNSMLIGDGKTPPLAARVRDLKAGRVLEMYTTEPGAQFYTGDFPVGSVIGSGNGPPTRSARGPARRPGTFPDSVHRETIQSTILRPDETDAQMTIYYEYSAS